MHRAKKRPAVVIAAEGSQIPRELRTGVARWQTNPTILVAPYYGIDRGGKRSGWKREFVERIRRCEYPQYIWDSLPISDIGESVLRLDHLQPIGAHANAYDVTPYCMSADAMGVLDEWLQWLISGRLDTTGVLYDVRQELLAL